MSVRTTTLRIGTRTSALAKAQAATVAALLAGAGWDVELVDVITDGDRSSAAITQLGGTGVFATALREQLIAGQIDLAVHSLKDLPTAPAPDLVIAAVPERADVRDVLVARAGLRLAELPAGARIGTGAPRRAAQLRALRDDVDVVSIRGNVDTRVRKVGEGVIDAVVLARAGLQRIDRLAAVTETFDVDVLMPAPGQGALAVECRSDDAHVRAAVERIDDAGAHAAVVAERALLAALEAGCTAPVGAFAQNSGHELRLRAVVAALDGSTVLRHETTGEAADPAGLGRRVADALIDAGAAALTTTARAEVTK